MATYLEKVLNCFESTAREHTLATEKGDYKSANIKHSKLFEILDFLKKE